VDNPDNTQATDDEDPAELSGDDFLSIVRAGHASPEQLHWLLVRAAQYGASALFISVVGELADRLDLEADDTQGLVEQLTELAAGDNPPEIPWATFDRAMSLAFVEFEEVSVEDML
jgi:hypothetical protein